MKMGNLQKVMMRTGMTVVAALMLSTASFAQEVSEEIVLNPVDHVVEIMPVDDASTGDEGIAVGEPDPNGDDPILVIDDGDFLPDDPGLDDPGVDDGVVDDGSTDEDDGMVWAGGDPDFCEACGGEIYTLDIPVEIYQMSAGGVSDLPTIADEQPAAVAAKPRASSKRSAPTSNAMIDCLAQHPQLPWMCEWQNGAGQ